MSYSVAILFLEFIYIGHTPNYFYSYLYSATTNL